MLFRYDRSIRTQPKELLMANIKDRTLSLHDYLCAQTKDQLQELRRALDVHGASQLNKDELVQRLCGHMLDHLEDHLRRLDHNRYDLLKKAMRAPGGRLQANVWAGDRYGEPMYYQIYGLLVYDGNEMVMPREIREKLASIDEKRLLPILDRNTEWVKLTQGMLFYYGIMPPTLIKEKLEHYTGQTVIMKELQEVLFELEPYDYSVHFTSYGVTHYEVQDPDELYTEQQSRPDVDYYPLTKGQAFQASDDDFADKHEHYRQFVSFLRNQGKMDQDEAEATVQDMLSHYQEGASFQDLFGYLQEEFGFRSQRVIQEMLSLLQQLLNHTRLWMLKGHTPMELSAREREHLQPLPQPTVQFPLASPPAAAPASSNVYSFETKQKVGRNDPCPCGSGKKYKKCCGG